MSHLKFMQSYLFVQSVSKLSPLFPTAAKNSNLFNEGKSRRDVRSGDGPFSPIDSSEFGCQATFKRLENVIHFNSLPAVSGTTKNLQ